MSPSWRKRALVAEDSEENQRLFGILLRDFGIESEAVANGELALARTSKRAYDLILLDMQMPVLDGYMTIGELRRRGVRTPVVACTGDASPDNIERMQSIGFDAIICKPFTQANLSETLEKIFGEPGNSSPAPQRNDFAGLRESFAASLPAKLKELRGAFTKRDMASLARLAHKLASASMFGFYELSELALDLEGFAKGGEQAAAEDCLINIEALICRLKF